MMLLRAASKNEGGGKLTQADVGFGGRKFIVCWEGGRGGARRVHRCCTLRRKQSVGGGGRRKRGQRGEIRRIY